MADYTWEELTEALRAIHSVIHKCEKAQEKFPDGNPHHTLLKNRLKAMYIAEAFITEALAKKARPAAANDSGADLLLFNLDKLHTTGLGVDRIKRNLNLDTEDVVAWCKEKIKSPDSGIVKAGKNWYVTNADCKITVNAKSYTIITAHRLA